MKYISSLILLFVLSSISAQNLVFVVIDGARYTETFGDKSFSNIPYMSQLALQGAYLDEMYNEHQTSTRFAIPALWTGSWDGSYQVTYKGNNTQATRSPSIFEYYRKQKSADASQCYYTLKEVPSLWLQSFHPDYGTDYWPTTISTGISDTDVLNTTLEVMKEHHPELLWVYLADVDNAGHSGDWDKYISSIQTADEIVNTIWTTIQTDSVYKDNTTMMITNDHGRHDDAHGGFSGHGCSCKGCQQVMFLAIGPDIKNNFKSTNHHELADAAVTASFLLDLNPEFSTGEIISEIFIPGVVGYPQVYYTDNSVPKLRFYNNRIELEMEKPCMVTLEVYNVMGTKVEVILDNSYVDREYATIFDNNYAKGVYILRLQYGGNFVTEKFILY